MDERRRRADIRIMNYMGWSWPEYLATPVDHVESCVREMNARATAED